MKTQKPMPPSPGDENRSFRLMEAFSLVENGRLKSTLLLYSFALAFVFLAIYAAAYLLLLAPLNSLMDGWMPVPMINWLEGLVPAALGTGVCLLMQLRLREGRLVPAAYVWLALMVLPTLLILLSMLEPVDRLTYLSIAAPMALLPLAMGMASSFFLYFRRRHGPDPDRVSGNGTQTSKREEHL